MKKIKLLHIASSYSIGLTNQETNLALSFKKTNKIDLTVLSGEKEQLAGCFEKLREQNIPSFIINGFDDHYDLIRLIKDFISVAESLHPDIILVNTNWQLLIVGISRAFVSNKYKIIYTVHGFRHNHPLKSIVARVLIGGLLFMFADKIQTPSRYVRDKFKWLRNRCISIPLGEDDIFFSSSTPPDFTRPLSFCFPGQFRKGKNQSMLIEAFSEYVALTKETQSKLILPGEGELMFDCQSLAQKLGISDQVIFPGQLNRQEMVEVYKNCQIALVPTNSETFGHCIAEPLIMRRIVLSRPVGIAPDVITHGTNGFIFNSKTQLVENMLAINSMKNSELTQISQRAGVTGQQFSWDRIAKNQFVFLLDPLLN